MCVSNMWLKRQDRVKATLKFWKSMCEIDIVCVRK